MIAELIVSGLLGAVLLGAALVIANLFGQIRSLKAQLAVAMTQNVDFTKNLEQAHNTVKQCLDREKARLEQPWHIHVTDEQFKYWADRVVEIAREELAANPVYKH